jgi:hypothetical protein
MKKTVADQFVKILATTDVERNYGMAGDTLTCLTDTIRRQGKIEWLHTRHEEVAGLCGRGGGAFDRRAWRLRGQLWAWQPSPDQRSVRQPPLTAARTCGCSRAAQARWLLPPKPEMTLLAPDFDLGSAAQRGRGVRHRHGLRVRHQLERALAALWTGQGTTPLLRDFRHLRARGELFRRPAVRAATSRAVLLLVPHSHGCARHRALGVLDYGQQ